MRLKGPMAGARILVADGEPGMRRLLRNALSKQGFDVCPATCGEEALAVLDRWLPDVLLLDLQLPGLDALDVCASVRAWSCLPIIALSTRGDEMEKVHALDLGADDHVTKPFSIEELSARIRVALRHAAGGTVRPEVILGDGDLRINFQERRVWRGGSEVSLTPREYDLLKYLVQHHDRNLDASEVLRAVWGVAHTGDSDYLRHYSYRLRNKLERDPKHPRYLISQYGTGLRFCS
jgi:two-component system, OmpR family, KDP operon response regulator KdpE